MRVRDGASEREMSATALYRKSASAVASASTPAMASASTPAAAASNRIARINGGSN
jgi:hypothetical protein